MFFKKAITVVLTVCMIVGTCAVAAANNAIDESVVLFVGSPYAYINGIKAVVDDNKSIVPTVRADRTFVPLRFVAQSLNASIEYEDETRKISVSADNNGVMFYIDKTDFEINGTVKTLETAPYEENGRTFVPIRAVSEAFGKKVFWDDSGLIVIGNSDEISGQTVDELIKMFGEDSDNTASQIDEITEQDANNYFEENGGTHAKIYAHGNIRPDEGTIEFKYNMTRPIDQYGNGWDFAFSTITSKTPNPQGATNVLAFYSPPRPQTGMTFLLRGKNAANSCYMSDFTYEENKDNVVACTWKAGGKINVYSNGQLMRSIDCADIPKEDVIPYVMSVNCGEPFRISEMKISTRELSQNEIMSNPAEHYTADSDTSVITTDSFKTVTYGRTNWHKSAKYSDAIPAYRSEKTTYRYGENVVYPLMCVNYSDESRIYTVSIKAEDAEGNIAADKKFSLPVEADSKFHIKELSLTELNGIGWYKTSTEIYLNDTLVSQYDGSIAVVPAIDNSLPDGKYGRYYGSEHGADRDSISLLEKLGATITREQQIFCWRNLEQTPGQWTWQEADEYVAECKAADIDILGVLGKPSKWATIEPTEDEIKLKNLSSFPERWNIRSHDEWANYIYTTVSRYKDYVKHWEIINEVNFHPPANAAAFAGTTEEYFELLRIAYESAKKADPDCVVLTSGFAVPGASDSEMPVLLAGKEYINGYYDLFNVHGYSGSVAFKDALNALRENNPTSGYWMSEYMPFQIYDEEQKMYGSVSTIMDFIADGCLKHIDMGLDANMNVYFDCASRTPKKCFNATAVLINFLRKCDTYEGKLEFADAGLFSVRHVMKRTDGKYLHILSANGSDCNIVINGEIKEAYDVYGRKLQYDYDGEKTVLQVLDLAYVIADSQIEVDEIKKAGGVNPIKNGNFEDVSGDSAAGLSALSPYNWEYVISENDDNSFISVTDDAAAGNYAISVKSSGKEKTFIKQSMFAEKPALYNITARIKKKSGENVTAYIALNSGESGMDSMEFKDFDGEGYTTFSASLESFSDTEAPVIEIGISSGEGEILIDAVRVEAEGGDDGEPAFNMITNGGFEDGLNAYLINPTRYDPEGRIEITTKARSGEKAVLCCAPTGGGMVHVYQEVAVTSPGKYKITAYFKRNADRGGLTPMLYYYNRDTQKTQTKQLNGVYAYKFIKGEFEIEIPEVPTKKILIGAGIYSGSGELLVDDLALELVN